MHVPFIALIRHATRNLTVGIKVPMAGAEVGLHSLLSPETQKIKKFWCVPSRRAFAVWSHHGQLGRSDVSSPCQANRKWNFINSQPFKGGGADDCLPGCKAAEFEQLTRAVRMGIVGHFLEAIYGDIIKHSVYTDTSLI